jgi:hypothetical protein
MRAVRRDGEVTAPCLTGHGNIRSDTIPPLSGHAPPANMRGHSVATRENAQMRAASRDAVAIAPCLTGDGHLPIRHYLAPFRARPTSNHAWPHWGYT